MSEAVSDILGQELSALAFCWRLERRDGIAIGLTSHDRDIVVGGFPYRAAPGLVPSAISRGTGLDVESMDLQGALSSDAICEADIQAGRWDGAGLWLHLTEWTEPGALWLELMRGELGAVEQQGESFSVELRGPNAVLQAPVAPSTSPGCRARLGDKACRVDLSLHRRLMWVTVAEDVVLSVEGDVMAGDFAFGSLRWMEGANCGLVQGILSNDAGSVTLTDPPPFAMSGPTRALLTAGCDRRIESCATRFGNAINFRGEPYLPGSDLLTRYPGAG